MYYSSGTGEGCCIGTGQTLQFTRQMAALFRVEWRHDRHCDVKSKIQHRQSMRIYVNDPVSAKFHPNPIWNNRALGFIEKRLPQEEEEQQEEDDDAWVARGDHFPAQKDTRSRSDSNLTKLACLCTASCINTKKRCDYVIIPANCVTS